MNTWNLNAKVGTKKIGLDALNSASGNARHRMPHSKVNLVLVSAQAPDGPVDPQVILAGLAHSAPSPELPEWAKHFDQGAELMSELIRDEERSKGIDRNSMSVGQKQTFRPATAVPPQLDRAA